MERHGRFLLVEETDPFKGVVLNQPAGHLEEHESLLDAVRREVLEETGYVFDPEHLVGAYLLKANDHDASYLRFCFCGHMGHQASTQLDEDIVSIRWMTADEIRSSPLPHRSTLVVRSLDDYLKGQRFPLSCLVHVGTEPAS
jgi:8-oxo-dGTP pyrophosphatase MutT (NUDIX family)